MGLFGFGKKKAPSAPRAEAPTAEQLFRDGAAAEAEKDYKKALALYEKAAEQGHAEAQFQCGYLCYNGEGTEADDAKAKLWLSKAAAQTEDKEAQEEAKKLLQGL